MFGKVIDIDLIFQHFINTEASDTAIKLTAAVGITVVMPSVAKATLVKSPANFHFFNLLYDFV